jgi:hypothetical protein
MSYDLVDILALIVSIFAVGLSVAVFIITFRKGKKTEEMKVAMELSDKLDAAENKIFDIEDQLKKSTNQGDLPNSDNVIIKRNLKDAQLLYMNHWEFYSFLVNNTEIDNHNIKKYFEPNFISSTDSFFKKYQDYISQEHTFEEIKKLRKHIGHEIKVVNH